MYFRIYDYVTILIIDAYITKKLFSPSFICDTYYPCICLKISAIICLRTLKEMLHVSVDLFINKSFYDQKFT